MKMYDSISQHQLFSGLSPKELEALERSIQVRSFSPGEIIFRQGDQGDGLYLVRSGTVKITLTKEGEESVIALMSTGEFFGELAVLDGEPRSANATAMDDVKSLFLPREAFLSFLREYPQVAMKIIEMLSRRLRQTDEMLASIVFFDVYGRVAKKLLELADSHGELTEHGLRINMTLTQKSLAQLVGASRESVNKALKFFRDKGYLTVVDRRLVVKDRRRLEQRAHQ